MKSRVVTVTTTPTLIIDGTTAAAKEHFIKVPRTIFLRATGADIHLGDASVSSSDGLQISKDLTFTMVINPRQSLWAVTSTGSHTVTVLEDS
jgi:hypothetical protein